MGLGWALHIHILAAIAWIGGSIFMFVLGVTMRDKKAQESVYPYVGPIFGYFEVVALMFLLFTGTWMITDYGLIELIFTDYHSEVVDSLRIKLSIVLVLLVVTVIHFIIALKTNGKQRTPMQNFISRGSSMLIFFLNLFVLHYAMVIRDIL
jgi:uncharacterized membrane protein